MADNEAFGRTEMLLGREAMGRLAASRVAVFGLGGVGGSCAEALARSGVGAIDLFDHDTVSLSNINRQAVALHSTVGRYKADVMAERIRDINPGCKVGAFRLFYSTESADGVDLSVYDCVADAIDTVAGKVELIARAKAAGARVVSAMGAGNRLDPAGFAATDIGRTETDPLARAVRKGLRARGVTDVVAVWTKEAPAGVSGTGPVASGAFAPPACGLVLAAEVVKGLIAGEPKGKHGKL